LHIDVLITLKIMLPNILHVRSSVTLCNGQVRFQHRNFYKNSAHLNGCPVPSSLQGYISGIGLGFSDDSVWRQLYFVPIFSTLVYNSQGFSGLVTSRSLIALFIVFLTLDTKSCFHFGTTFFQCFLSS
jgi:hypothetical protein